jgi:zinc protease
VHKGVEPKANTIIDFTGACESSPETRFAIRALTELFQIKINETLREQLGGAYSPSVGGGCNKIPRQEYSITVQFNSAPDNVEKLTKSVFTLIDSLKKQPPSQADVDKVREQLIRSREVDVKQNAYWLNNILGREQAGEDISTLLGPYDAMIRGLTPAQIQQAAQRYFDVNNYARFILLPEAGKTTP